MSDLDFVEIGKTLEKLQCVNHDDLLVLYTAVLQQVGQ